MFREINSALGDFFEEDDLLCLNATFVAMVHCIGLLSKDDTQSSAGYILCHGIGLSIYSCSIF